MHKQSVTLQKTWPDAVSTGVNFGGLVSRFKNALKFEVPTAYQDETGFHFGVKPAEKEVKWPMVW
jgi:hypothetical protein